WDDFVGFLFSCSVCLVILYKGLHLRYQANSVKLRRVISYLTFVENILRHSPLILRRTVLSTVLNHFARTYRSMVLVY
ncbi:IS4 family transposase, partial [Salmonella enterica]|nr:IS4 family transposase [Salmonella enterica]